MLRAWRDSPTRFTEDTNAERDLRVGAYRDRLFVELAQNAADAAFAAKAPGRVRVSVVDGELRVANTGTPLDPRGVESLASLRASGKEQQDTVGRFGVGFAAVLTVTDEPRVVSTTGGVVFSASRTREAAEREGEVPVLRLLWPTDEQPPAGYDTEVRLPLRDPEAARSLLGGLAAELPDLLLALPWLAEVEVDGRVWMRSGDQLVEIRGPGGDRRWLTHEGWAVPVDGDGVPLPLEEDVLHAPTPTDDALSLPARLIATVPVEPSRRRVLPGAALTAALEAAAKDYVGLVRAIPAEHRFALVPVAGFPRSTVDAQLRDLVFAVLAEEPWLSTQDGTEISGRQARVLDVDVPGLPPLLADLVPGLVPAPPGAARVLKPVFAQPLSVAEVLDRLTGISREPEWWHRIYAALAIAVDTHDVSPAQLDGLPVPLSDGRTLPGARGALLVDGSNELLALLSDVDVPGLRLVHPAAAHALLERLGAKHADARQLLEADQVRYAVERSVEDVRSGSDGMNLAGAVLRLIAECGDRAPEWAGALALPAEDGWRRADELVLPESPLLDVFDPEVFEPDGAMSVLDDEFAGDWPQATLVATGVLDSFAVVRDEEPHEPDHGLPDEESWWDSLEPQPPTVVAVRDLDLVADDAWPAALRLLAARPETWQALHTPEGHARWWLARYALLAGEAPGSWRLSEAVELSGLYDVVPDLGLTEDLLLAAGVRTGLTLSTVEDAADLLDRLGDAGRTVSPGLAARAHRALTASDVDVEELGAPVRVRVADGSVAEAELAVVLDVPWPAAALDPARVVAAPDEPERLAELLDLPPASSLSAEVTSVGEYVPWAELPALRLVADQLGLVLPDGGPLLHDPLTVTLDGAAHDVPWWSDGRLHAADTSEGLARAFAWATGRWAERYRITALLDDPSPRTLLN
ncbi:sacsin N-terminal ATP-binding-like domain-containing protein [Amycolatopsis sp. PS_44_ISF1]|uniref:sacsin N-terminal ATP-binding-like domain-containing protein n=1 Tax=Amycolatopsis sp. PS_44_ISF1 TaxID=2974917 RepID=UPI0028DEE99F|nr:molecular chaperone Hsp90 [Amycolatopsis sp. PS_44_ISF1]MDT8911161.1 molecular chaperone Hsp90 [Amycolatopsis sp. PS_44_ISF1]MDT8916364.1 molecular chaperone Hsp90 [Amycolatopsis sp. PS_44_ISF1]